MDAKSIFQQCHHGSCHFWIVRSLIYAHEQEKIKTKKISTVTSHCLEWAGKQTHQLKMSNREAQLKTGQQTHH